MAEDERLPLVQRHDGARLRQAGRGYRINALKPETLNSKPRVAQVLAVNAAKDATDLVAKLRAYHHAAQTKPDKKHLGGCGLDLVNGVIRNNMEARAAPCRQPLALGPRDSSSRSSTG